MSQNKYLIALSSIPEIGPATIKKLVGVFGSPEAIFSARLKDLKSVDFVGEKKAKAIKGFSGWDELEKNLERLKEDGIRVVSFDSAGYPEMLKNIPDAPLIIYMRGEIKKEDKYAVAVVGTRKPTDYGVSVTETMSSELAFMGFTIISGLARGIDTAAHMGALRAGGRSIGVLGSGIDVPYPPENKGLMRTISESGAIISEFPPGTNPNRENFPRRNRIISGLSLGVLVVEAQSDSGSLITANCALEQNKEVFSIPGNINSENSAGTNALIKSGAKVVMSVKDIVEELAPVLKGFIKSGKKANIKLSEDEKRICDVMSGRPKHVDDISRQCAMPSSKTLGVLLNLELKGVAGSAGGSRYYLR